MSELIHNVLLYLEGLGYWGIFLGLMLEVIPNELLLAYAGYLVSKGEINFCWCYYLRSNWRYLSTSGALLDRTLWRQTLP